MNKGESIKVLKLYRGSIICTFHVHLDIIVLAKVDPTKEFLLCRQTWRNMPLRLALFKVPIFIIGLFFMAANCS
jgi:hypothetical protein